MSWDDVEAIGLGTLQLKPKRFWNLTFRDFLLLAEAHQRREADRWQHTRYLAAMLANVNRAPDTEAIEPNSLFWLPGDHEPAQPQLPTPEKTQALFARVDELDADLIRK